MNSSVIVRRLVRKCHAMILVALPAGLIAQSSQTPHSHHQQPLAVLVDGKKTPELISDDIAYQHLVVTFAGRRTPSAAELHYREGRMLPLRLSKEDSHAFVNALLGVKEQLEEIDAARMARKEDPQALRARLTVVLQAARARLDTALTADGQAKLNTFVQTRVKPNIVIYGK